MNKIKIITSLVLGAGIILGAQGIMAKADRNEAAYNNNVTRLSVYEQGDGNDNYYESDEEFYREMYNRCHGNNSRNQSYRNNMRNNNNNMMEDYNDSMMQSL